MFDGSLFDLSAYGPKEPENDEPTAEETDDEPGVEESHQQDADDIAQNEGITTEETPVILDVVIEDDGAASEIIDTSVADIPLETAIIAPPLPVANATPTALYRKYRPQSFDADDLFGQDHVVNTLRNAIALDRIAHAYLFCGPRGTGKTTTARILAKAVNCEDPDPHNRPCNVCRSCVAINSGATTDVIEIDAASNRGIDDIRDLRERVKYAPTQLRTKFYIIDEAHQITGAAANAFLKTLEEPPAHTKFILATTDPEDLLQTIVSRCQRFDFRRIPLDAMVANLTKIAAAEQIEIEDDAKVMIARHATGSLRDAQGLLDQVAVYRENADDAGTHVTVDLLRTVLGVSRNDRVEAIATALADRDAGMGVRAIGDAVADGEDVRQLARQLLTYMRELLLEKSGGLSDLDATGKQLAQRFDLGELAELTRLLGDIDFKVKHATIAQLPLEIAVVEGALRGSRPAQQPAPQIQQPSAPASPQPEMKPAGSGSLINRVRSGERRQPTPQEQTPRPQPGPLQPASDPAPAHEQPAAPAPQPQRSTSGGRLGLETLRNRWGQVRADVSAVNVRIGALMSEMDPAALEGNKVILTFPYPFHAGKMNSDDTRPIVEDVLTRVMGTPLTLECFTTEDFRSRTPRTTSAPAVPEVAEEPAQNTPTESIAPEIDATDSLRALRNIFDAEEIDPEGES